MQLSLTLSNLAETGSTSWPSGSESKEHALTVSLLTAAGLLTPFETSVGCFLNESLLASLNLEWPLGSSLRSAIWSFKEICASAVKLDSPPTLFLFSVVESVPREVLIQPCSLGHFLSKRYEESTLSKLVDLEILPASYPGTLTVAPMAGEITAITDSAIS